jgi:transcription initiation factor TFIIIB Brf1 subunit/transcription initiation factor TFIIB
VCPGCGIAMEKQVVELPMVSDPRPQDAIRLPLGSYMGSRDATSEERSSRGITGVDTTYVYLKTVSDFAGRDEGSDVACARLIERVGEKLCIPRVVLLGAASTASKVLSTTNSSRRITVAAVSAYSLISACRVAGIASVSVRDIIDAHLALGKKLSLSSIIQLTLESPVRTYALGPEAYLSRVIARLSANRRLPDRLSREGVHLAGYLRQLRESGKEVLELAEGTEMLGKRPCALAASAIYSAEVVLSTCEGRSRRITQREAAECGDTSEYTVRDQCAEIFTPAVEKLVARRRRTLPPPPAH